MSASFIDLESDLFWPRHQLFRSPSSQIAAEAYPVLGLQGWPRPRPGSASVGLKIKVCDKNKTNYIRLRLSQEVSSERPKRALRDLRLTWARKMKIGSSRQVRTRRTNGRRLWLIELLTETKSKGHLSLLWDKLWGHWGHEADLSFSRFETIQICNTCGTKFQNQYCLWQNVTQRDRENVTLVTVWALRYNAAK